jgi:hypothetical protein
MTDATPPPGVMFKYKLFGTRVPEQYREWVYHEIMRPSWLAHESVRRTWPMSGFYFVLMFLQDPSWFNVAIASLVFLFPFTRLWQLSAKPDQTRKEALDHQAGKAPHPFWGTGGAPNRSTIPWVLGALVLAGFIYFAVEVL